MSKKQHKIPETKRPNSSPQTPIHITNQIINNVSEQNQNDTKKPHNKMAAFTVAIGITTATIAGLTFLFGEGVFRTNMLDNVKSSISSSLAMSSNEIKVNASPILNSEEFETSSFSNQSTDTQYDALETTDTIEQISVSGGQTAKIYTNGEDDIKVEFSAKNSAVIDHTIIKKKGDQSGTVYHNKKVNSQGAYIPISKWEYLYITVIEGELIIATGENIVIEIEELPSVASKEIYAGDTYETMVIGKGTANLTLKGIEENTKGELCVYPVNGPPEAIMTFDLFQTDRVFKMVSAEDRIIIKVSSGAVEMFGDSNHFLFE